MKVNAKELPFEVNTGAAASIIVDQTRMAIFPDLPLESSTVLFRTYTNENMSVIGELRNLTVQSLVVVKGSGVSLLGRDWLRQIQLDWKAIWAVNQL